MQWLAEHFGSTAADTNVESLATLGCLRSARWLVERYGLTGLAFEVPSGSPTDDGTAGHIDWLAARFSKA